MGEGGSCPARRADDHPLVLVAPDRGRLVLAAVDAAAAGEGLSPGLPLAEARALVPGLASAPFDPAGDAAALAGLAEWCTRYTPWAALDGSGRDTGGAAGILLDITGCAHLFANGESAGEDAVLADLVRRLGRRGLAARAALAETAGAAWALARCATADGRPWIIAPPDAARDLLAPLPPAALRLDPATVELLARLGLRRIGDLYDLPPATLAPRFGPSVARRLAQALGAEAEPISPHLPVPPHLVRRVFAEPIVAPEDIARGLAHLAEALARRLEADGQGARRLELGLHRVDGTVRRLALGTSRPSRDPAHLARLFAERLERIDPGFGIEVMTLAAPASEDLGALQLVLPDRPGDRPADRRGGQSGDLAALIDRLGSRLGLDNVVRPLPRESHVPERAVADAPALGEDGLTKWLWQMPLAVRATASPSPSTGEGKSAAEAAQPAAQPWAFRPRPVRLLPRAEPVEAIALLPDHPPARFRWRCLTHTVVRAEGPERIEPEWWLEPAGAAEEGNRDTAPPPQPSPARGQGGMGRADSEPPPPRWGRDGVGVAHGFTGMGTEAPARDYFRVEAADGRRYWLYRAAGRWFLHGMFG